MRAVRRGAQLATANAHSQRINLVVNLLLGDRAGALAHLLLHLVCGSLILLLQLLLLLAVLHHCFRGFSSRIV